MTVLLFVLRPFQDRGRTLVAMLYLLLTSPCFTIVVLLGYLRCGLPLLLMRLPVPSFYTPGYAESIRAT
jgi:hypothetical protein